jgi:chlorite dismutase
MAELPAVPLTLEGAWMLHQMFRIKRAAWRELAESEQTSVVQEMRDVLASMEPVSNSDHPNQSAAYSLIGHKGDLILLHFRDSLEELHRAELSIARTRLADYLEPSHSYLSVVELGLYESSAKTYTTLSEKGIEPFSDEWKAGIADVIVRQSAAMAPRLFPEIPRAKYICFYPMDRKRAEQKNWYQVPMQERQRLMHEHGMIGRRYAGEVRQIISGSIGFDDWEWGVDLFADDPLVFKKLIYEMRFDEVSAVYALFGSFYVGIRIPADDLSNLLSAQLTPLI